MRKIQSDLRVLSDAEIQLIHDKALKTLAEMGMQVPNDEVLDLCREAGCQVDADQQIVKFPPAVMEDFLTRQRAYNGDKNQDEGRALFGKLSTQISIVDYKTNQRRYGVREDNLKSIALVQHLAHITTCNAAVVPSDVPADISEVVSLVDINKYSSKPGITYVLTPVGAKYVSEINKVMGQADNYLFESISPLSFKKDTVDMALQFAKNGGILNVAPMAMSSATAPITLAGTMVLETAEVLGSSFLVNVMTGQFPHFASSCHSVDLKTMLCSFGSPNQALFAVAAAQMGKFYGINSSTNSGLTDALFPDFQGGFEKGVTAAFNSLAGSNTIGCQGIVGADQGFSMEQLVLDNEWLDYYNYMMGGIEVNEDTLGFDAIQEAGIRGNFLGLDHTVEHMRQSYWMSNIFNRDDYANWVAGGSKQVLDRAHEFVQEKTKGYQEMQPVIAQAKADALDDILKEAFAEMKHNQA